MASNPTRFSSRGRALLERLVRARSRERLAPLLELRGRARDLNGSMKRSTTRIDDLEMRLKGLDPILPRQNFHPAMTIDQAWNHHPGAAEVFARYHLPACNSCAVRFDETLEEAAAAYGLEIDTFLRELNTLLTGP